MIRNCIGLTASVLLMAVSSAHEESVPHVHDSPSDISEHTHSHSHSHHDHDHSDPAHTGCTHGHSLFVETNIHKQFAIKIGELTGFCCVMEYMDQVMRPLPMLAQGLLSTLFISVVPIFFIFLMNSCLSEKRRDSFVHVLLSFALGGLLGDVFFHTMPHIMEA